MYAALADAIAQADMTKAFGLFFCTAQRIA
jgi:hypothetical protein